MSYNIYIRANRKAYYEDKQGVLVPFETSKNFNTWQTITQDTNWILKGETTEDKLSRYCDFVKKRNMTEIEYEYDENDTWREDIIGSKEVNLSDLHITDLNDWIKTMQDQCFTIEVYTV